MVVGKVLSHGKAAHGLPTVGTRPQRSWGTRPRPGQRPWLFNHGGAAARHGAGLAAGERAHDVDGQAGKRLRTRGRRGVIRLSGRKNRFDGRRKLERVTRRKQRIKHSHGGGIVATPADPGHHGSALINGHGTGKKRERRAVIQPRMGRSIGRRRATKANGRISELGWWSNDGWGKTDVAIPKGDPPSCAKTKRGEGRETRL
ncbi:hypothetical protein NL676_010801 [Syzygium grande]|nr:hypothetical protein NL676_010801 [Syzygium grande]